MGRVIDDIIPEKSPLTFDGIDTSQQSTPPALKIPRGSSKPGFGTQRDDGSIEPTKEEAAKGLFINVPTPTDSLKGIAWMAANGTDSPELNEAIDKSQGVHHSRKTKDKLRDVDNIISDDFLRSIASFLPQLVGGLGAAAIGGSEAGLAASKAGAKIGTQILDVQAQQDKRDQFQQQVKLQSLKSATSKINGSGAELVDSKGNPVLKRTRGNSFDYVIAGKDGKPQVVPPGEVRVTSLVKDENITARFKGRLTESQLKSFDASKNTFVQDRAKNDVDGYEQIIALEELLDSGTKFTGLIDFKMAKGIAREVGNLAEKERDAAAQMVGFKGDFNKFKEYLTSDLSDERREEIRNLITAIKPNTVSRIKFAAKSFSKSRAKRFGIEEQAYTEQLLDDIGIDFRGGKGSDKPQTDRQKRIQFLKNKYKR